MYHPSASIEQVKFAAISANASADLVAAVAAATPLPAKRIRVLGLFLTNTTANGTIKFQSGASTDLTGAMSFPANGPLVLAANQFGWFQTVAGEKLNFVLASTGQVSGGLVYQEV